MLPFHTHRTNISMCTVFARANDMRLWTTKELATSCDTLETLNMRFLRLYTCQC